MFRVRVTIRDRFRVGMVLRVMVQFPLSIQWRDTDANISKYSLRQHSAVT